MDQLIHVCAPWADLDDALQFGMSVVAGLCLGGGLWSCVTCASVPTHPLTTTLLQVGLQLCSKDWRNRMDALRGLSALGPALPEVPNAPLEGLLQALIGRLSDGNAKVNQKALEVRPFVLVCMLVESWPLLRLLKPASICKHGWSDDPFIQCCCCFPSDHARCVSCRCVCRCCARWCAASTFERC